MTFNKGIHTAPQAIDACHEAGIFEKDWFWQHENALEQWHGDALTIMASKVLLGKTILWDSSTGKNAPVHESRAVNPSPGTIPQLQAYLFTHAQHGTHIFVPINGCKGGKKGANDDVEVWTSALTQEDITFLKEDMDYYVQPKTYNANERNPVALQALRDDVKGKWVEVDKQKVWQGPDYTSVDGRLFLVRHPSMCACTCL